MAVKSSSGTANGRGCCCSFFREQPGPDKLIYHPADVAVGDIVGVDQVEIGARLPRLQLSPSAPRLGDCAQHMSLHSGLGRARRWFRTGTVQGPTRPRRSLACPMFGLRGQPVVKRPPETPLLRQEQLHPSLGHEPRSHPKTL
jgi:hypothetical protein